jgi:Bacterial surface protein, Ig-like domain/Bacterial TSP3 repeat
LDQNPGDDADSDGLTNLTEYQIGTNPNNADSDGDGMPDGWEVQNSLSPSSNDAQLDADNDGLSNLAEFQNGTNPRSSDSDSDGMPDGWEVQYGLSPVTDDAALDPDDDGLTNLTEYQNGTTNPNSSDSDGDGVPDQCEAPYDTSAPTLTILGSDPVNLCYGETYTDPGATAMDNCLGDITGNIVVSNPVNTSVSGTYIVTYNVQDGAGNSAAQVTRTVYVDVQPPVITLQGENPLVFCPNSTYEDPGASASDNCGGNLSSSITVDNPVDMNQPGNYTVTYNVTDSAGNHAQPVTRTVVVVGGDTAVQIKTIYDYDAIGRLLGISKQVQ